MRVVTILGTRPEIIRLSLIMKELDRLAERHAVIHTGQNFTATLSDIFFQEMNLRQPDYLLKMQGQTLGGQLSIMMAQAERILLEEKPDRVLILGDTNSALCAVLAERMGIPVVHMEAGNRCFDLNVPEEKNRKVVDAISSINMPYTKQSRENLIREGIPGRRIVLTGNPIYEVLTAYGRPITDSAILQKMKLQARQYFLVTAHRSENVDSVKNLTEILEGLNLIADKYKLPIVCSTHPRTTSRLSLLPALSVHPLIQFHEPFGFFDFVHLEQKCFLRADRQWDGTGRMLHFRDSDSHHAQHDGEAGNG